MTTFEKIIETALRRSSLALPPVEERKRLRQAIGIRGDDLARSLNIKPATFYRIERGEQEPKGEVLERLVAFYTAAGHTSERRRHMSSVLGFSQPYNPDPPRHYAGSTEITEADLVALLHTLKAAGDEGLSIVRKSNTRSYGNPQEETHDRLIYLSNREPALVSRQPSEDWKDGEVVALREKFVITTAGLAAIGEVGSA